MKTSRLSRVAVFGGGLAGLTAAYELSRRGHQVTILEASSRIGGRVFTLRKPFSDGLYAEAGALAFSEAHDLVLRYCSLFRLSLDRLGPDLQPQYFIRGNRIRPDSRNFSTLHLSEAEQKSGLLSPCDEQMAALMTETGDPLSCEWPGPTASRLDAISLGELLRQRGASSDALLLMGLSHQWNRAFRSGSALAQLAEWQHTYSRSCDWFVIVGGNDLLPRAFAQELAGCINFDCRVTGVEQDSDGVRVRVREADGAERTVQAERAVCALPASTIDDVSFSPELSARKQLLVEKLEYESVVRIYLQCGTRFWRHGLADGWLFTDLPIMNVRECTFNQYGTAGILSAYVSGPETSALIGMTDEQRAKFAADHLESIYPGLRSRIQVYASHCWDRASPFAPGAYAWVQQGQVRSLLQNSTFEPEGRIHFAGAHTSRWFEWQQGAIESGLRVANEIHHADSA